MFKFIYKILLIAFISGSLTTINLSAYAQDGLNTTAIAPMSKAETINFTRDADGVLSRTDKTKIEEVKDSGGPIAIITMLAIGVIGTKLLMYEKWTLDMTIVAAASALYIAGELVNLMNLKNELKEMDLDITKRSDGKTDQTQIDTLKKLKESYEAVKKSSKIKKMLQLGAAAAFAGATAVASYQYFTEEGQFASCMAAIHQGVAVITPCASRPTTDVEQPFCTVALGEVSPLEAEVPKIKAESEVPAPSESKAAVILAKLKEVEAVTLKPSTGGVIASGAKASIQAACESYYTTKKDNAAFGKITSKTTQFKPQSALEKMLFVEFSNPNMSIEPTSSNRNVLQKMVDLFLPKAEASIISMLGLGVGAAAAYFTAQTSLGTTIDNYIFTPGARIILWGIFTGAALMASKSTQTEIEKVDGHIKKIDQILTDLNTLKNGVKFSGIKDQVIDFSPFKVDPKENIPLNINSNVKTDCLASAGSSDCKPLSDSLKAISGFTDLPNSFQSIATQTAQIGDGLSGKSSLSGSTLGAAGSLGDKQAAIAKLGNNLKNKINKLLSKNGNPKRDFAKEELGLWNKMKGQTASAFKSRNTSPGGFLASAGLGSSSSAPSATPSEAPLNKNNPAYGGDLLGSSGGKDKGKDYDLDLKDKSAEGASLALLNSDKEGSNPNYDIGSNDINTNSGDSIFEVISNRYIKSAYPKLFEEIPVKK